MGRTQAFCLLATILCLCVLPSQSNHKNGIELQTENNLEYKWMPVKTTTFHFKIRAPNDAHIALTSGPSESGPMVEVFIGGWRNTKSVIRHDRSKPDVVTVETPKILNGDEYSGFWIRWSDDGTITVENEGDTIPFMSWKNPEPFKITYVGVSTGWGAEGNWLIDGIKMKE